MFSDCPAHRITEREVQIVSETARLNVYVIVTADGEHGRSARRLDPLLVHARQSEPFHDRRPGPGLEPVHFFPVFNSVPVASESKGVQKSGRENMSVRSNPRVTLP